MKKSYGNYYFLNDKISVTYMATTLSDDSQYLDGFIPALNVWSHGKKSKLCSSSIHESQELKR